ncbi:hypothetical protein INT45_010232, partial [Circinella minor]
MLSSDQTVVAQNNRAKLWPIYMKLANVPQALRDSEKFHASRVLAYLPTLEQPKDGKTRSWWPGAKQAIIHHCLRLTMNSLVFAPRTNNGSILMRGPFNYIYDCIPALAAYSADLPE